MPKKTKLTTEQNAIKRGFIQDIQSVLDKWNADLEIVYDDDEEPPRMVITIPEDDSDPKYPITGVEFYLPSMHPTNHDDEWK